MMEWNQLCITDINVANKRIIIRTDLDAPIKDGYVSNNERIIAAVPTIKYALEHQCHSILLISHLGEADGRPVASCSLKPALKELNKFLSGGCGLQVNFVDNYHETYKDMYCYYPEQGAVVCLENIQFHLEEIRISKDKKRKASRKRLIDFCRNLKRYGDVYVNDAFRYSHLVHTSVVPLFIGLRVAGLSMKRELDYFRMVFENPRRPILAILGGDKLKQKLKMMDFLLDLVDELVIAGDVAFTFLKHLVGMDTGSSPYSTNYADRINAIMDKADEECVDLYFPKDFVTGDKDDESVPLGEAELEDGIPFGLVGLDIGPKTIYDFCSAIVNARTIVWNGALGALSREDCREGSIRILQAMVYATDIGATTVVVGEDLARLCEKVHAVNYVSHISIGEPGERLLMGQTLPGVRTLLKKTDCHW